jgi:hypothetical protein
MRKSFVFLAFAVAVAACDQRKSDKAELPEDTAATAEVRRDPIPLPETFDKAAILQAVEAANIRNQEFVFGQRRDIGDGIEGQIDPHVQSHATALTSGKLLARISVTADVESHGWMQQGYTYWVAAQFKNVPGWRALMVNLSRKTVVDMAMVTPASGEQHTRPYARFVKIKDAARAVTTGAWNTCDGGTCCCTGSDCEDTEPRDSLPGDTTKHKPN